MQDFVLASLHRLNPSKEEIDNLGALLVKWRENPHNLVPLGVKEAIPNASPELFEGAVKMICEYPIKGIVPRAEAWSMPWRGGVCYKPEHMRNAKATVKCEHKDKCPEDDGEALDDGESIDKESVRSVEDDEAGESDVEFIDDSEVKRVKEGE